MQRKELLWRKRQVIFGKMKCRAGYTCLVNPHKVIVRTWCL